MFRKGCFLGVQAKVVLAKEGNAEYTLVTKRFEIKKGVELLEKRITTIYF